MTHLRTVALATVVAATAALATCGTAAATPLAASAGRKAVVVDAGKHGVTVAATTRPGVAEFRNTGAEPVLLVTPLHGASKATLAKDIGADTAAGLIANFSVADLLPGKATTFLRLATRTYYLAGLGDDEVKAASIATLRVTGAAVDAKAPRASAITVTAHDTVSNPTTLPRRSELAITNASSSLQELLLMPVATKVTAATLKKFLAKPSFDTLDGIVDGVPSMLAMLSPKARAISSNLSAASRYLIVVIGFTSHTTEPQLKAGKVRLVTVK